MTLTTTTKPLVVFQVSRFNEPNPQPESAAVGSATAISPVSKGVRLLCVLFGCLNALAHELVLAANVGPKHDKRISLHFVSATISIDHISHGVGTKKCKQHMATTNGPQGDFFAS